MNNSIITKTSEYFKNRNIVLPTISELSNPHLIDESIRKKLKNLDKDAIDPLNLFRVHWFNNRDHSDFSKVPEHIVLPSEFTGVKAKINNFETVYTSAPSFLKIINNIMS